jgi:hypothetical protein
MNRDASKILGILAIGNFVRVATPGNAPLKTPAKSYAEA